MAVFQHRQDGIHAQSQPYHDDIQTSTWQSNTNSAAVQQERSSAEWSCSVSASCTGTYLFSFGGIQSRGTCDELVAEAPESTHCARADP